MQRFRVARYLLSVGTDAVAVTDADPGGLLERLYVSHVPKTTRIAYLLTGDAEVARELSHEAYLRTSRRLSLLRNPDAFGTYMTRTAINLSKRYGQRRERERRYLDGEATRPSQGVFQPDIETRDELLTALRRLPHRQRTVLVLRFFADFSDAAIAEVLDSPTGTVRSLISRGLESLREQLGENRD